MRKVRNKHSFRQDLLERLGEMRRCYKAIDELYIEDVCGNIDNAHHKRIRKHRAHSICPCLCGLKGFGPPLSPCIFREGVTSRTLMSILGTTGGKGSCAMLETMIWFFGGEFISDIEHAIKYTPKEYITDYYLKNIGLPRRISKVIKLWKVRYDNEDDDKGHFLRYFIGY